MAYAKQSILAVHSGALGDVILLGHLLRALGGGAAVVAGGEKAHLLAGLGAAGRALDFDVLPMHEVFSSIPAEQCRLPLLLGGCERLVSCFAAGNESAQGRLALLAGAKKADFLPIRPPPGFGGHLLELWARQLAVELPIAPAPWPVPQAWRDQARESLKVAGIQSGAPYWVIHPGAGSREKCWPLERFVELALRCHGPLRRAGTENRVSRCHGPASAEDRVRMGAIGAPVLVLGPVERERWGGAAEDLARRLPLLLCPPLTTLAGVLAGARAYVGNDSGVSHLSAAVGTATVALFGEPNQRHFAPRGARVTVVSSPVLADITVERVWGLFLSIWG
jgi:hypothetical protein